jgi:hypothetical protein
MLPGYLRSRRRLHHVPGAAEVGVDHGVPALDRKIDRGLRKLSAGAVDETVDAAVRGPHRVEQCVDGLRLPDVGDMGGGFEVSASQLSGEGVELVSIAPDNGDMRAEPCEQPAYCPPDAAAAARHHNNLAVERIDGEHGRMDRKLGVGEGGFWVGIIHGWHWPLATWGCRRTLTAQGNRSKARPAKQGNEK